jgi:NAD(P)-dependent dehydrogenase (short-subunit alcohol dehydrogenase family)
MGQKGVAVVTGASQGMGRQTALLLAERGYRIPVIDLRPPAETVDRIRANGFDAVGEMGDITDEVTVERFVRQVFDEYGRADVLVNNAGISLLSPAEQTAIRDYRRVLDVNLLAPFLLSKAFGTRMLEAGPRIDCHCGIGRRAGGGCGPGRLNASKRGLIGLTRTLAAEWGGRGVRVNAVCPGWVKTEMDLADQSGGSYTDADIIGKRADGPIRRSRRCRPRDCFSCRRYRERLCQRPRSRHRWRLDCRRKLGPLRLRKR